MLTDKSQSKTVEMGVRNKKSKTIKLIKLNNLLKNPFFMSGCVTFNRHFTI